MKEKSLYERYQELIPDSDPNEIYKRMKGLEGECRDYRDELAEKDATIARMQRVVDAARGLYDGEYLDDNYMEPDLRMIVDKLIDALDETSQGTPTPSNTPSK